MARCPADVTDPAMSGRRILLLAILAWALVMIVPDLVRVVQPLGSFGFYANGDGLVYDVKGPFTDKSASPAWKAGIRDGDRIDLERMSCLPYDAQKCASVLAVLGGIQYVLPGRMALIDLAASPERPARKVSVVAAPRPTDWTVRIILLLDAVAGTLVVLGAAWLVWKRPGRMSWGFFLYAVWFNPGQSFVFYAFLQQWPLLLIAQNVAASVSQGAGYAGLLLFALRVPNDVVDPAWRRLERALPLLAVVFIAALLASYGGAFGISSETSSRVTLLAGFAVDAAALYILLRRRRSQPPEDYQRVRWVIWGCAIGLPVFIIAQLMQGTSMLRGLWGATPPDDLLGLLFLANGVFCLFVVQAMSRKRVVSVTIPLRRVTLLGLMLSLPALLLHHEVEEIHDRLQLPDYAWLAVAVVTLYLISRLHEFAVELADRYFNRSLDRSESALSTAIVRARRPQDLDRDLSEGPFRALALASAAIFLRDGDAYVRAENAPGWDESCVRTLHAADPLVALASKGAPFNPDLAGAGTRMPEGLRRPVLAVPVANRVRCFAIALYGPHASAPTSTRTSARCWSDWVTPPPIATRNSRMTHCDSASPSWSSS